MAESAFTPGPVLPPDRPPSSGWTDERVEQIIGNLLRAGVLLAAAVVATGGILYLFQDGTKPAPDRHIFRGEHPRRVVSIVTDAWHLKCEGLIELGLLLLILTPIARVVFSIVAFALEHDKTYVVITLLVLAILLYSLFSGHIH
jgi:uncharacterized membrane protein